jgi:UDP-GlcNAc3NAcA epimerase
VLARLGLAERRYAVATVHRAGSTDNDGKLAEIIHFLRRQARYHAVVLPLHPRTRQRIDECRLDTGSILLCEPLGYFDMQRLLQTAIAIYTDSGGLQKEAYFHRVPCVTLRDETEWVETVAAGWNRLWQGPDYASRHDIAGFGDGHAARKALAIIVAYLECRAKAASAPSS